MSPSYFVSFLSPEQFHVPRFWLVTAVFAAAPVWPDLVTRLMWSVFQSLAVINSAEYLTPQSAIMALIGKYALSKYSQALGYSIPFQSIYQRII